MGNATMYLVGSYMLNEVKEITGDEFNWGCFAFPAPEGSEYGIEVNTIGMQALQVAKNATDPELAFYFATFFTTGEYDKMMSEQTNSIPTASDTEWPAMLECAKIMLPLAQPGIITVGIFLFVNIWNEFFVAMIFAASSDVRPLAYGLYSLIQAMSTNGKWAELFSSVMIVVIPTFILYLFLSEKIIAGVTGGGIKE